MTVRKEENGTWSVRCWYRDWQGQRKQKTKRGFLKQKDAKQWERQFLAQEQKQSVNMNTLIEAYKQYMVTLENLGNIKASTRRNKLNYIERYIDGYFGSAPIENITPTIIDEWLSKIARSNTHGERMSSGTLKMARSMLSQIFDYGKKAYNVSTNPVKESTLPATYSNDKRAKMWTIEQFNIFYATLTREMDKTLFLTLYWAGLRIGELLALTPADIYPNIIVVNKTWVEPVGEKGYASTPKTKSSNREVIIPAFVYQQLQKYISTLDCSLTDRIFPIYSTTPTKQLASRCETLGLPKISLHTLRHSYASNFIAETKDYVAASAQLGHASPEITLKIYAHKIDKNTQKSVEKLAKLGEQLSIGCQKQMNEQSQKEQN